MKPNPWNRPSNPAARARSLPAGVAAGVLVLVAVSAGGCASEPSTSGALHEEREYRTGSRLPVPDREDSHTVTATPDDLYWQQRPLLQKPLLPQNP